LLVLPAGLDDLRFLRETQMSGVPPDPVTAVPRNEALEGGMVSYQTCRSAIPYQCDLYPIDFVALAQAIGANGVRIETLATAGAHLDKALAMPGPVIIEAVADPFTGLLLAKIMANQAPKFSEAFMSK
jgi:thiamine pyrophosphate-dependent acetolactate synthase large subunit-like protein